MRDAVELSGLWANTCPAQSGVVAAAAEAAEGCTKWSFHEGGEVTEEAVGYSPELGQAVFGAAWSELEAPAFVEHALATLGDAIEGLTDENPTYNVAGDFKNEVFEMRSYYWGDCTCGFDEKDWAWSEGHKHTEECWHTRAYAAHDRIDDVYGDGGKEFDEWAVANGWGRQKDGDLVPGVLAYCDCGHDKAYAAWRESGNDHSAECLPTLPNFRYGDFEVRWYKYLGRGMSMNRPIQQPEMTAILRVCLASLKEHSTNDG
jgi:hypothetical protein